MSFLSDPSMSLKEGGDRISPPPNGSHPVKQPNVTRVNKIIKDLTSSRTFDRKSTSSIVQVPFNKIIKDLPSTRTFDKKFNFKYCAGSL